MRKIRITDSQEYSKLKQKLEEIKRIKEQYIREHKIEFFKPLPHQQKAINFIHQGKKIVVVQGGNRVGKSTVGVCLTIACCLGYQPWDKKPFIFKPPVKCRIVGSDWEHSVKNIIVAKLKEWAPAGSYVTKKNSVGVETFWQFDNGSTIEIMTYVQDTKLHEGWGGHWVWFDEEVPYDKFTANLRGLVDYSGVMLLTFTALYETWILDELVLKNDPDIGVVSNVPIWANEYLDKEYIKSFEKKLTDEEKIARIDGGWIQLTGLVIKEFNKDIHVIEPFSLLDEKGHCEFPVIAAIDLHLTKPQAIGFYMIDDRDRIFVVDEVWADLSPDEIADEIIKRKEEFGWRIELAIIDPLSKGDERFMSHRFSTQNSFTIIRNKLSPYGIRLEAGSKDRESAIRNIKMRLKGQNGMPSLFFFRNCERHIWEIQRWTHEKFKENDDMMENLGRVTVHGIKYVPSEYWNKPLNYAVAGLSRLN